MRDGHRPPEAEFGIRLARRGDVLSAVAAIAPGMPLAAADNGRLRSCIEAHTRAVWRVVRRNGVPASEADDAVQRVFVILSRRLSSVDEAGELSFLLRTATLIASETRRSIRRRHESPNSVPELLVEGAPPEEAYARREAIDQLDRLLDASVGAKLAVAFRHAAFSKISVAIVAVAVASGGGYVIRRMHDRVVRAEVRRQPSVTVGSADAVQVVAPQRPRTVAPAVETVPLAPPSATAAPSTPPVERYARRHDVAASHPTVAASTTPSIVGELNEIRLVRSLVVMGDGKGALDALNGHVTSRPGGTFEEEALVRRVRALRLTGDLVGAGRSLRTLETRFPNSVYLESLEP